MLGEWVGLCMYTHLLWYCGSWDWG
jgi:hypothetical protein